MVDANGKLHSLIFPGLVTELSNEVKLQLGSKLRVENTVVVSC
jgi:hypothetical protein